MKKKEGITEVSVQLTDAEAKQVDKLNTMGMSRRLFCGYLIRNAIRDAKARKTQA